MKFKPQTKRPEKSNAIDYYLAQGTTEEATSGKEAWQACLETVPEPLSIAERKEWLGRLKDVVLASDAFFPFRDNVDRAYQVS
jgi:phosphoribosylaminoimidazolecarboxamide formyltransferase/IMP cyclohydrolase